MTFNSKINFVSLFEAGSGCVNFSCKGHMICDQTQIMQSGILPLTEYEEEIVFDVDDPDFQQVGVTPSPTNRTQAQKCCSVEARVAPREGKLKKSYSFDVLPTNYVHKVVQAEQYGLTIEEFKTHLNTCFTCGVSWLEDQVSLDCPECGGYSLQRPCITCNGQCKSLWQRDFCATHSLGKAKWTGKCTLANGISSLTKF